MGSGGGVRFGGEEEEEEEGEGRERRNMRIGKMGGVEVEVLEVRVVEENLDRRLFMFVLGGCVDCCWLTDTNTGTRESSSTGISASRL